MIVTREHLHERRLARLSTRRRRDGLAQDIEGVLLAAGRPASRVRVLPARGSLHANSAELRRIAARLRSPAPVDPEAVASLTSLLGDGTGPVYTGDAKALSRRIQEISEQLARDDATHERAA